MSIRIKLILSYFVLIIISLIILAFGLVKTTGQMMTDFSNNAFNGYSFQEVATSVMDSMVELEYISRHEKELFSDVSHMTEVEATLNDLNLSMYVSVEGKMVYESQFEHGLQLENFVDQLVFKEGHKDNIDTADYKYDGHYLMIFRRSIDDDVYVYVIYEAASKTSVHWNLFGGMYRFIIIVILMLLLLLTLIVTKDIIKPLNKLEDATNEIRQGNLEFSIKTRQKDEFGRVMNAFDTMREELKHSIEQQLMYEENRKELIASISHDLKTPITSIKGYVEGIRDGIASDEAKLDQYLNVIYYKAIDMDKLIDDLFLFSKLDLKRQPFNFTSVKAKYFFDDCGEELAIDLAKYGFVLNFENELNVKDVIHVDQQQLRRVITNVINNAMKYSMDNKQIDMDVIDVGDKVRLIIRDYGKGIDPSSLEKIFEMFYRADPSRNQEVMGSGLGLAIAKQIMEGHNGTIRAESTVGEGTTIYIEIGRILEDL